MKTLSPIISLLFTALFLFFTSQNSYAAHATSDHVLINLIVAPKKAKQKKSNWKEKLGLSLLEKHIQKRIKKLQAKERKNRTSSPAKKNKKKQTHPLSIISATLMPVGVLLAVFFAPIISFGILLIALGFGAGAIITGISSQAKIRKNPEQYTGKSWATLGITLGILTWLLIIAFILLLINLSL